MAGKPSNCSLEEGCAGCALLVTKDLDVGEARRIVDADMGVLPADTSTAARPVVCDPMTWFAKTPELLHIKVQKVSWVLVLVANYRGRFPLEVA